MSSDHQYFDDPGTGQAMALAVALAGEVFVLKALNQRLTQALVTAGVIDAAALDAAGEAPEMEAWMARERAAFARALLDPALVPDQAQARHDRLFANGRYVGHVEQG